KKTRDELDYAKKIGAYVLAGLAALLISVGGFATYRDFRHEQSIAKLTTDLAAADAKMSLVAEKDIPQSAPEALQAAVYLLAKKEKGHDIGLATAWVFAPDKLATNAHVTEAIKGHEKDFLLIGPNQTKTRIQSVRSHPGYQAFKNYKMTQGSISGNNFKPLDV